MAGNKNSGRRPKATALKLLTGNPGKRRLNEAEPKPPSGDVVMPAWISAPAVAVWTEIAPVASSMGTLTPADVWAFGRLCELESSARESSRLKGDPEHPFSVKLEMELAAALRPYYERFGLDPSGRSRIKLPESKPVNPLDRFIKRA
jgi:phage terminase small subunit